MDIIYVSIYVPLLNETFDLKVSNKINVKTFLELINSSLENITVNNYTRSDNSILYSKDKNFILPYLNTLFECHIKNGETLYLF